MRQAAPVRWLPPTSGRSLTIGGTMGKELPKRTPGRALKKLQAEHPAPDPQAAKDANKREAAANLLREAFRNRSNRT